MRLTNLDRNAFIAAVLKDVPMIDYQEEARKAAQKWAIDHLPPKLKALQKDLGHYLKTDRLLKFPHPLSTIYVVTADAQATTEAMESDDPFWTSIKQMARDAKAQVEKRDALKAKIRSCIYACSTVKQAHERMPEFAAYLKTVTPAPDRSVPVVANLVSDLVAAGWPAGKKPNAKRPTGARV